MSPAARQGGTTGGASETNAGSAADGTKTVDVLTWSTAATVEYLKSIADAFHEAYPEY